MHLFDGVERRIVLFAGVALSCSALMAVESITIDRVRQRTPWNGLVDIDYTIDGVTGDPNDFQIEFTVTAGGKTFVASNFWDAAWCDHATANGPQRATWIARADGIAEETPVSVTAKLIYAPVTDASAEFAIVDLSGGPNATSYPVRYVAGDTNRTAQFNIDAYKLNKLVLKKVRAGEFWMGEGCVTNGTNRHRVRLTKDYFMGLFEVTRRQYWNVLPEGTGQCTGQDFHPWGPGNTDLMPIHAVSYNQIREANGFLSRVNARATCRGQSIDLFSLPTEAQWEYMTRAGVGTTFFWGTNTTNEFPQYASMRLERALDSGGNPIAAVTPDSTTPVASYPWHIMAVGSYLPNPWGFYDVYGNVAEWCSDNYGNYPAYSEDEVTEDPTGPDSSAQTVNRGGCFWEGEGRCSSGGRIGETPEGAAGGGFTSRWGSRWGFRVCCGLK